MELIKLNLEIPYEKAGAEKPESAAQLVCYLQQPQNMPVPRPAVVICPGGRLSLYLIKRVRVHSNAVLSSRNAGICFIL